MFNKVTIRVKEVMKRKPCFCIHCNREIQVNEFATEIVSLYDCYDDSIVSEYSCCVKSHDISTITPAMAFRGFDNVL